MPVITFSKKDFDELLGKKLTPNELRDLLDYAKAELEHAEGDTISVKYNDTNQPYLWCPEGLALLLRGILGKETGLPKISTTKTDKAILVDKTVKTIRPYIAGFIAKGPPLTEYLLKLFIQLQEKLADSYGRHREYVSLGLYPADKITWPATYKAVKPDTVKFMPLDVDKDMTLNQILEHHPKGKEYGWILAKHKQHPLLVDAKGAILSYPPIINSQTTGRLTVGEKTILIEATGTSKTSVELCAVIFAYALAARGYTIHALTVKDEKPHQCPNVQPAENPLDATLVAKRLGLDLTQKDIEKHLKRFRYGYDGKNVQVPPYRQDIMHAYDIIEDIGIAYGYNNIKPLAIHTHTRGASLPDVPLLNALRDLCVGLGCQEVFSQILSNPEVLYNNMNVAREDFIEIENYTSATYSCVRSWILPILLSMLAQNRKAEAPYKVFEEGLVTVRDGKNYHDEHHVAVTLSHAEANFTQIKQFAEHLIRQIGKEYTAKEDNHPSFIPGRCGALWIGKHKVAFFGELHPAVLEKFNIDMPTVGLELNVSVLQ
ncbi:phenylalanine--tRNA ligase subunit beta [Candidatus Woesearchaeota archaeon]|nr:phenylalanine--tRNA ligase subunit beta [Candidatus Woesearchaeota archaeon]